MNQQTTCQSPRKRPRPQSTIRNPYAKQNSRSSCKSSSSSSSATATTFQSPRRLAPELRKSITPDLVDGVHNGHRQQNGGNFNERRRDTERNFEEQLELTPESGGITEGLQNLSLHDEKGDELQEKAIALMKEGKNIFLTGKAGTGKSWTIRRMVMVASQGVGGKPEKLQLTAPTGIAAINIGGRTIHSWGGFFLGENYSDFDKMMSRNTRDMIRYTDKLLIDEISMVDGHLFDVLECMVAIIRCYDEVKPRLKKFREINDAAGREDGSIMSDYLLEMRWKTNGDGLGDVLPPWGGIQLIVVGDFFQLPPVPNTDNDRFLPENENDDEFVSEQDSNGKIGRQGCYAFQSQIWQRSDLHTVELQEVHRQADDDGLFELLNDMREGKMDLIRDQHAGAVLSLQTPLPERNDGIVPTELHARNRDVDAVNARNLELLTGPPHEFESLDEVVLNYSYKKKLLKKHGLLEFVRMPYLFASVEAPSIPPPLQQARDELHKLETKKDELKASDKFEALIAMRPELAHWKETVDVLEDEEREKSEISVSSIVEFLGTCPQDDRPDPVTVFENFQRFDEQLQHDFEVLEKHARARFFQNRCRAKDKIMLKKKSQVMLLWNLDVKGGLANGSRGILKEFVPLASYKRLLQAHTKKMQSVENNGNKREHVESNDKQGNPGSAESEEHCKCTVLGIPCICKHIDSTRANETEESKEGDGTKTSAEDDNCHYIGPEIFYDRSSHPEKLEPELEDDYNYSVDPGTLTELKAHVDWLTSSNLLAEEQRTIEKASLAGMTALPYVQFTNGKTRLILPVPFKKEFKKCGHASRWQIPLCLAWAISIHKSQGMTIDWLHVDLKGCFDYGQAYVACSRGKSLKRMAVKNFNIDEIKTSENVKQFYKSLSGVCRPYTTTWSDTIAAFDNSCRLKKEMERRFKDKRCDWCGTFCVVRQVKKKNYNEGKFFVACPKGKNGDRNHCFEWIPVNFRHP